MRRTKIVCTIGPASENVDIMSTNYKWHECRPFKFSHGSHDEHARRTVKYQRSSKDNWSTSCHHVRYPRARN